MKDGVAIGAHEILYPFNQAYDSVAVRADVEIGGTDQLFNLLFGREIQKAYGQEPQDVAVFPLLEGLDGSAKMGKSLNNYIGLTEAPEQIYGKTMSIPDSLIEKYLRLVSGLGNNEVITTLARGPRIAKGALARQLVKRLHSEEAAERAEQAFNRQFVKRELPESIPQHSIEGAADLVSKLVETGIASTRNDARRLIEQGGVRVNNVKADGSQMLKSGDILYARRRYVQFR